MRPGFTILRSDVMSAGQTYENKEWKEGTTDQL